MPGIIITVNEASVFWQSKRQTLIALSFGEAEYIAASQCSKHVLWLRCLFRELCKHERIPNEPDLLPTGVQSDSTVAISLTTKLFILERNKLIDRKCY